MRAEGTIYRPRAFLDTILSPTEDAHSVADGRQGWIFYPGGPKSLPTMAKERGCYGGYRVGGLELPQKQVV